MPGFVFRLIPPRPSFPVDMSAEERAVMAEHVAYWRTLAAAGQALAFGPVNDPAGPYGIGIIVARRPRRGGGAAGRATRPSGPAAASAPRSPPCCSS